MALAELRQAKAEATERDAPACCPPSRRKGRPARAPRARSRGLCFCSCSHKEDMIQIAIFNLPAIYGRGWIDKFSPRPVRIELTARLAVQSVEAFQSARPPNGKRVSGWYVLVGSR
jgi:hypothetical protein